MREARLKRLSLVAAVGLLALAVGIASRPGGGSVGPVAGSAAARVGLDALVYLFLVVMVLGSGLLAWLIWPQKDEAPLPPLERRRHPLAAMLALALALLVLIWWRSSHPGRLPNLPFSPAPGAGLAPPGALRSGSGAGYEGVDWAAAGIVVLLLAVAAVLIWRWLRAGRPRLTVLPAPAPTVADEVDDALADSLDEPDPRRAVIAAWARVERVLAAHGAPRRPAEAPHEYAARAPDTVGSPLNLEGLADLYEWARFSVHAVTPRMRADALRRLAAVREGLRPAT